MSKSHWKLTDNGVPSLYEEHFTREVRVQVIFKSQIDDVCYLRVSDGRHLSPIVIIITDDVVGSCRFCVGAIIAIKERELVTACEYDDDHQLQINMEDQGITHVCIKNYTLVASHKTVGCVLGSLDRDISYRDDIRRAISIMTRWDSDKELLKLEEGLGDYHLNILESNRLREQGNKFFRQENFVEAITFYDVATYKNPFDCRLWSNSSHAHFKMEEYLEAELHALIAIKMNPFYEKAYYRAGQAALKDRRRLMGELYAERGIFICGMTKELQQILEEASKIPYDDDPEADVLSSFISDRIKGMVIDHTESIFKTAIMSYNEERLRKLHMEDVRRRHADLIRGACGRDQRDINRKGIRKAKKPGEDVVAALAAAATMNLKEQQKSSKENKKEDEEKKLVQETRRETKNHKPKINFHEALEEGKRLFLSEQFHQAIEMYNKSLTLNGLGDHATSNNKGRPNENYEVQVINFIIGMCKVQCSRGYIFEGLEAMKALCDESCRFPHKTAARYWMAVSFEKICCFKLAQKHVQLCRDALKKPKVIKPVRWPNSDEPIICTLPSTLEDESNSLLGRTTMGRPTPKAKCRFLNCITTQGIPYAKEQIYLMDPDFKGYLNVICEENCTVSYHPCCWKALKEQHDRGINRMSDKDFLGEGCVTPDCTGKISSIHIFDDLGELKNEVVKDKKDKKHMAAPVKQKKKKDKKKEKAQAHKKRTRLESTGEDPHTITEEASAVGGESNNSTNNNTQNTTTTSNNNNNNTNIINNKDKNKVHPIPELPIDPESLEKVQVTILKPGGETPPTTPSKAAKKNKKRKAKKAINQPNLLGDPLEADLCVQSEYIARLRALRQQREAMEGGQSHTARPTSLDSEVQNVMLLDPDNPFYLPEHLRDNPEELERVLQAKLTTNSPSGLEQDTINTLLDFMYDWLKSEGPMHVTDPRLAEQVDENFPPEARDYVTNCSGITGLLMRSIKFAMIDSIICVYDDVMIAQEMICNGVTDKMGSSKYLIKFSDGQKAKNFTHLLDDAKSTCSNTSLAESILSTDSLSTRWQRSTSISDDHNNNNDKDEEEEEEEEDEDYEETAPISKKIVTLYNKFSEDDLNPLAQTFEPHIGNTEEKDEEEEEDEGEEEEEEEEEEVARMVGPAYQWSEVSRAEDNNQYVEEWAAAAQLEEEDEHYMPDVEVDVVEEVVEEKDADEEIVEGKVEDDIVEEDLEEEEEEEETGLMMVEDMERTEQYIRELQEEKENLVRDLQNEQEQNQALSDKLYQIKSQYKSEVQKLKRELEELRDQNKELSAEKSAIQSQKETDTKKQKSDMSKIVEEVKSHQNHVQSLQTKNERLLDENNELKAKLAEETEVNTQLKGELGKMKSLQESLTSCSRRARDAEVQYLCTKRDLVDTEMRRTINRLTEETTVMRQLLPRVKDDSSLDRTTLTRTIVAWDETIKKLLEQQQVFKEELTRLLGMVHQGRPLSALSTNNLPIPAIPYLTVAPLLNSFMNNSPYKAPPAPAPLTGLPEGHTPPPPVPFEPQPPSPSKGQAAVAPPAPINGHLPPNAYASGAIPKTTPSAAQSNPQPPKPSDTPNQGQLESANKLFVGQLPWEFSENDVKALFSRYGEVVSVAVYDKGLNAEGKTVPKYGFVSFRYPEDCLRTLSARPIFVRNHMLNVQVKEPKKPAVGGGVGGGEPDPAIGKKSSINGLSDGSVSNNIEVNKTAPPLHPVPPPPLLRNQPRPPITQAATKPKFQKLLPSSNPPAGIVAPPPKLVRPQGKTVPNTSKLGGQTAVVKEENAMPVSSSYTRLIDICKQRFGKEFSSPDICNALREVRTQNNNSLSGLTTDRIVDRVKQHLRSRRPTATVAPWAGLTQGKGAKTEPDWQGPSKGTKVKEESCSICLEPLHTSPNQSLACLHTFHALCINDWIKIQSSCPNCRKFALMPDEYPTLPHN